MFDQDEFEGLPFVGRERIFENDGPNYKFLTYSQDAYDDNNVCTGHGYTGSVESVVMAFCRWHGKCVGCGKKVISEGKETGDIVCSKCNDERLIKKYGATE